MRSNRHHSSWPRHAAIGAVGGLVATWAMTVAQRRLGRTAGRRALRHQRIAGESSGGPATETLAARIARPFGVLLNETQRRTGGRIVRYAYGALCGAALGLVDSRLRPPPLVGGSLFGAALWLVGDELLVPALRLAPPPHQLPLSTHGKALAAHMLYGAVADSSWRALSGALEAMR